MSTALLIIDVQKDYFKNGKCELVGPELALEATKAVLDAFRKKGEPVYFIQHIGSKDATFFCA